MDSRIVIDGVGLKILRIPGDSGSASHPTLVFLHDSLGSVRLWRDFPERLGEATGCQVMAYDRQGYGESDPFESTRRAKTYLEKEADTLEKVLEACRIERAILYGHSDGGSIALLAAAKHPQRLAGLVVEAGHVFIEKITLEGIRAALEAYRTTDLKERLTRYHGNKVEALFEAWSGTWLSEEFRKWNIEAFLPRIISPLLVLQGERDEFGSERQVEAMVGQVRGPASRHLFPGLSHTPHKEAPEETLAVAAAFIRGLLP